jgi:GrpB-like predicted nucleotidyltransferase (UPF0157 family)
MIGLKRGTVRLVSSSEKWRLIFEEEKRILEERLGDSAADVEHIGSTAIPGILAKPIIDIDLGVRKPEDFQKLMKLLADLGYEWREDSSERNHLLFAKGPEENRTHYLHAVEYGGTVWRHDLLFRDYLRKHPGRAAQYAKLKEMLAGTYRDDRGSYTSGKRDFILETLSLAEKEING